MFINYSLDINAQSRSVLSGPPWLAWYYETSFNSRNYTFHHVADNVYINFSFSTCFDYEILARPLVYAIPPLPLFLLLLFFIHLCLFISFVQILDLALITTTRMSIFPCCLHLFSHPLYNYVRSFIQLLSQPIHRTTIATPCHIFRPKGRGTLDSSSAPELPTVLYT